MPTKIYQAEETDLWAVPAAATQAEDAIFECDGIADGTGWQSAQIDLGAAPRSDRFKFKGFLQLQATTPVVGNTIRQYLSTSRTATASTAKASNDDGLTSVVVSAEDKLKNLMQIDSIIVDQAAADIEFVASGEVTLLERYVQIVWWNASGAAISTDVDESGFVLTPIPMQSQ